MSDRRITDELRPGDVVAWPVVSPGEPIIREHEARTVACVTDGSWGKNWRRVTSTAGDVVEVAPYFGWQLETSHRLADFMVG